MSAADNYVDRLERRLRAARAERERIDEACRRAARLAIFEPNPWSHRHEAAWRRGYQLDQQIEDLEERITL